MQAWMLDYPPRYMAYFMMSITMSFHPFALSPGTLHRVMVAESDDILRKGLAPLHWFPIAFMLPGCLIGLVAAGVWPETGGAFTTLAEEFLELGGVYYVVASILLVSCIASFMSTADSIVLAVSNAITEDLWVGFLSQYVPAASPEAKQFQVRGRFPSHEDLSRSYPLQHVHGSRTSASRSSRTKLLSSLPEPALR
jgi:Na+/pantothenate symporter